MPNPDPPARPLPRVLDDEPLDRDPLDADLLADDDELGDDAFEGAIDDDDDLSWPIADETELADDDLDNVDDEPTGEGLDEEPLGADDGLDAIDEPDGGLPVIPLALPARIDEVEVSAVVDLTVDGCTWRNAPFDGSRPVRLEVAGVVWTEVVRGARDPSGEPRLVLARSAIAGRFLLRP